MAFLRIIAGRLKGTRLVGPRGPGVRPTSDRLRETLFNVLGPTLGNARVLDAFAGTGALGFEALSRGAGHVTFVERDRAALAVLEENLRRCEAEKACAIIRQDFLHMTGAPRSFDLVLLDPPYEIADLDGVLALAGSLVAADGRVALEHAKRRDSPLTARDLRRTRVLTSGDSALSFYAPAVVPTAEPSDPLEAEERDDAD